MDLKVFSQRLKEKRESRKLAIRNAAMAIDVANSEWLAWEQGIKMPSARDFLATAVLLNVEPYWLAGDEPPKQR